MVPDQDAQRHPHLQMRPGAALRAGSQLAHAEAGQVAAAAARCTCCAGAGRTWRAWTWHSMPGTKSRLVLRVVHPLAGLARLCAGGAGTPGAAMAGWSVLSAAGAGGNHHGDWGGTAPMARETVLCRLNLRVAELLAGLAKFWTGAGGEPGCSLHLFPPPGCRALRSTCWGSADDPAGLVVRACLVHRALPAPDA